MPSIYDLKPKFQALLQPIIGALIKLKITPNQVTIFALVLSWLCGATLFLFANNKLVLLLVPIVLFLRMALNALDGMLARQTGQSSKLGEILNEVGDVLSDAVIYFPLVFPLKAGLWTILLVFKFVFLAALTEFCGLLSKTMNGIRAYQGPMGKSDRAFAIGAFCLVVSFVHIPEKIIFAFFSLLCLLLLGTCYNRLKSIF